jgi:hypothetical protein
MEDLEAMEIALGVLTALSRKGTPNPADVAHPVEFVGPRRDGMDLDELACMVIQRALKKRQDLRLYKAVGYLAFTGTLIAHAWPESSSVTPWNASGGSN